MNPAQFSAWADLIPEALLLVSDQGRILALNPPAQALLGAAVIGRDLAELDQGDPETLARYLRACLRSRQPLPGALTLAASNDQIQACRCHGALLTPGPDPAGRRLLLRLSPRHSTSSQFAILNDKIAELTREIARRRRAEAELEAQRGKLQITLDSIGDGVIVTDTQGRITSLNPVAGRLTGWGETAVGQPLETVFRIVNEQSQATVDNPVIQVLHRGAVVGLANHTLLIARDGSELPIDDSAAPIRAGDGSLLGVVLVFRDITGRKQAEQRFRELADSMPQIVFTAGPDGRLDYCNQRWYECFGQGMLSPNGAPGWQASVHPADIQPCLEGWRHSVQTGEPFQIEYRLLDHGSGSYRWHLGRAIPAFGEAGQILRWYGTSTDIDEQKRSGQRMRFLAEASATLADLVDYESTLQKVARLAVPRFADWCTVDILDTDQSLRQLAVAHPDPARITLARQLDARYPVAHNPTAPAHRVLDTGRAEWVEDISDALLQEIARDDEHLAHLRSLGLKSSLCLPLQVKGRRFGVITFLCAESGYRYTGKDLALAEDLVRRAAIALENARLYREVKEADRRKDEFLAMLAHELRNPLAPIRTGLDLLGLQPQPRTAMEQEIITLMKTQVQHVVRLVDDLLDVSRIMRGKSELKKEPVDLGGVLERAVETVQPLIADHQQQLTVSLPEPAIELDADPVRLAQVLGNLLHNATKYTPQGGHIWLSARRDGDSAEIRTRDDGLGIDPDLLPQVFDLFTQSRRSMDRSQGGLGIGLTVARSLVEMHDGSLTVHSRGSGTGSEFVVRLPIRLSQARPSEPQPTPPPTTRACILIVDDNADIARTQQLLLSKLGPYHVHTAHDGPSALAAARRRRPDLILLDIGLPGMNGYEVARQLRQDLELHDTLLVALTGYGQPEDRRRSHEAGFDEHLIKPPSLDALQGLLAHPKLTGRGGS